MIAIVVRVEAWIYYFNNHSKTFVKENNELKVVYLEIKHFKLEIFILVKY